MTLIKSISGIRGTIGGVSGSNLTPIDIVECTAAYAHVLTRNKNNISIVVGRDGRVSGQMVHNIVTSTLIAMGITVLDAGLSTTPSIEMLVSKHHADAGIIITASHNPFEWNALKFLNDQGEFISSDTGSEIIDIIEKKSYIFAKADHLGKTISIDAGYAFHIDKILKYTYVDAQAVRQANLFVIVDCINSTGAQAIPPLLDSLGVRYLLINDDNYGHFAHNPEPLKEHLTQLSTAVKENRAHMGIVVDPDVDRLAFIDEHGEMFGEEYTLVAIADHILSKQVGHTVSNLSSTRALRDITHKHGGTYSASAVGEVNVVKEMKKNHAILGGEGNGGIIIPELHYGRDAIAGIALFLTYYAEKQMSMSKIKSTLPAYEMIKSKIDVEGIDQENIFNHVAQEFKHEQINTIDGVKIDFDKGWVHLRKSNTEPIIRIYAEGQTSLDAQQLVDQVTNIIKSV